MGKIKIQRPRVRGGAREVGKRERERKIMNVRYKEMQGTSEMMLT